MSKSGDKPRLQGEFLFVIDGKLGCHTVSQHLENAARQLEAPRKQVPKEDASAARAKLIAELREFGC